MNEIEPYSRRIFYYETDRMGIVHNSNYLRIFEEARLDFMNKIGVDYRQLETDEVLIPQTEVHVKYGKVILYDDKIEVAVKLVKFNGITMTYEYEMFTNGAEKASATGSTTHCFLDDKSRFPLNMKKKMPEIYEKLNAATTK